MANKWKYVRQILTKFNIKTGDKIDNISIEKNGNIFITINDNVVSYDVLKKKKRLDNNKYDVILLFGQSNTHFGLGYDAEIDFPVDNIKQFGRFDTNNYKIIPATEPLENHTPFENRIGFVLTFAKMYSRELLENDRKILIVPCGKGSTGFLNDWKPGDYCYEDAKNRVNNILNNYNSRLVAMLWHQGESDTWNTNYQEELDNMINTIRTEINDANHVPFILGGLVPYWINIDDNTGTVRKETINNIIKDTPNRIYRCGFADPTIPTIIEKENPDIESVHYDAIGLREMGKRYYNEYKRISQIKNNNKL